MSRPPLIGITAGNDPHMPEHYVLRWDYVYSVSEVGGVPVILAPGKAAEHPSYLESFDGLVLSGGSDISPERYGQEPHETLRSPSAERDEFELGLAQRAIASGVPVLAICRGLQVLNVALGGTLIQDLPSRIGEAIVHDDLERPRHQLAHEVSLDPGTRLLRLLGRSRLAVNSFHHQSVDRLGDGLTVTARADDGVVEAVEMRGPDFVLGVQWHPECFWREGPPFLSLFGALVAQARARPHARS